MFFEEIQRSIVSKESRCYTVGCHPEKSEESFFPVNKKEAHPVDEMAFSGRGDMRKGKKWLASLMPAYGWIAVIFAFSFNTLVYTGSRIIAGKWFHHNIETAADRMIPFFAPSAAVYLGCYVFWAVNYILIARQEKKEVCRFFAGDFLSRLVCLFFYLIFPTTNVRPVLEPDGFWNQIMLWVYSVDAADNLFPSIHCLVSWLCYIGIRKRTDIPCWYRRLSCVMAVLVCISTLTTKQHVLADVAGGIVLAEICLRIGRIHLIWERYEKVLDRVNCRLFREKKEGVHAEQKESAV